MSRFLPPSKVRDATITQSILGDGCVVKQGCDIKHSVIGLRSQIGQNCKIHDTLYMGCDYYETEEECLLVRGCLPMGLGTNSCRSCYAPCNSGASIFGPTD
jgi:glucose-1-phosphate adenylyltransferase